MLVDQGLIKVGKADELLEVEPHRVFTAVLAMSGQLSEVNPVANAEKQHESMAKKLAPALGEVGGFGYYCVDEGLPLYRRVLVWISDTQK